MFWIIYVGMFLPCVCYPLIATCFSQNIVEYVSVIYLCSKFEYVLSETIVFVWKRLKFRRIAKCRTHNTTSKYTDH